MKKSVIAMGLVAKIAGGCTTDLPVPGTPATDDSEATEGRVAFAELPGQSRLKRTGLSGRLA